MRTVVGRMQSAKSGRRLAVVKLWAHGQEEGLRFFQTQGVKRAELRLDRDEARRIAIALLDECNYCDEEDEHERANQSDTEPHAH